MHRNCERARKRGIRLGKLDKLAILRCSIGTTFETALSANRDGVCFHQTSREGVIDFELRQLSFDCEHRADTCVATLAALFPRVSPRALFLVLGGRLRSYILIWVFWLRNSELFRVIIGPLSEIDSRHSSVTDRAKSPRLSVNISEKLALFPHRVPRRYGWRIFKSATARENSCGNKYRGIGGKRVSVCVYARRAEFCCGDSIFCRDRKILNFGNFLRFNNRQIEDAVLRRLLLNP